MASTTYILEQVRSHNKKDDGWIILPNKGINALVILYNITTWLDDHPGGEVAGLDATEAFEETGHSDEARELLEPYLIGALAAEDQAEAIEVYRPTFEKVSQVAAVDVRKRQRSTVGLLVKSLLAAVPLGLAAGLGYSVYSNGLGILRQPQLFLPHLLQEIHLPSGTTSQSSFWSGVGIDSALQISLTGALTVWLSIKLDVQESFASHKPYRPSRADTLLLKSALKSIGTIPRAVLRGVCALASGGQVGWEKGVRDAGADPGGVPGAGCRHSGVSLWAATDD
ncbi:cytochrome b5-like heme/steroid binding domain-containing protein [Aspergillus saccharolyticus JOP 1030-1]|uniref:Cytochrome b5 n=1 Tax=Aspergillus saccharolyticus JOP 1030-1 TaxID=1450539 RepID=A0A318ZCL3_9EURO|nr:cytochrome b5 [Aspergillus saccharolyticus JOP 1030-1]PYH41260.1 cytochrome b5 [Aspergillus saccharolyticus JOP 1030-1]